MPRPPQADPPFRFHVSLPTTLVERLDGHLHSKLQGKVPYGARSELIGELVSRYLALVEGEQSDT